MLPIEVIRAADSPASKNNLPSAHVMAITDVESSGQIYAMIAGVRRPLILPEPHVFYRLLPKNKRGQAVAKGLASERWNKRLYPRTQTLRWDMLNRMSAIDPIAALEATSFGVGQVLGGHWKQLGFTDVKSMVDYMHLGAEAQIDVMLRYVVKNHLDDELREGRWAAFARGYNGRDYRKNRYAERMAAAARRYGGAVALPDGMLRMGAKGSRVRELQALLIRAGYQTKIDGDFGAVTRNALMKFQRSKRLVVDGVYGPKTEQALSTFRQGATDKPGAVNPLEVDGAKEGLGGVGGGVIVETLQSKIDDATGQLQTISSFSPWLSYALSALSLFALAIAIWGTYRWLKGWLSAGKTVEA